MANALRDLAQTRPRAVLIAIVLAAIALRVGFWIAVVGFDTDGWGDEPDYHRLAAGLAAGKGFLSPELAPTAARPPLYPLLLAGLYAVTGPHPDAGRALSVALGALIVVLIYALGSKLFSRSIGLLAAVLAALNPSLIYLSALLMTESLYIAILLLVLLAVAPEHRSDQASFGRWIAAGTLAGLSYLARPTSLLIVLAVALSPIVLGAGHTMRRIARCAAVIILAVIVVLPWGARNHARFGAWILSTTHGGITFYESNNRLVYDTPEFHGTVAAARQTLPGWDTLEGLNELEFDRAAWGLGKDFVRKNPSLLPEMAWWKFQRFWRMRSELTLKAAAGKLIGERGGAPAKLLAGIDLGFAYSVIVIPLFLFGVIFTIRRWRDLALLYAVVIVQTFLALVFHGSLRARSPVEPAMAIFAAAAAASLLSAPGRRTRAARVRSDAPAAGGNLS